MTARAAAAIEMIRRGLVQLDGLTVGEQEAIVSALAADLRARNPVAVAPLSVLASPTTAIRDPREVKP